MARPKGHVVATFGVAVVALVGTTLWATSHDSAADGSNWRDALVGGTAPIVPTQAASPVGAPMAVPLDMLNPKVSPQTQANTICKKGWTGTIRPPQSYTSGLKGRQLVSYGYADRNFSHYEEDHVISLELGGNPSNPANLFPENHSVSFSDDHAENSLRQKVCAHKLTLADAQVQIYTLKLSHGYDRAKSLK